MKKLIIFFFSLVFCLPAYARSSVVEVNWHDKGIEYFKTHEYQLAIEAFTKAMQQDPGDTLHHQYHRGSAYVLNGQAKKALIDLKAADQYYACFYWLHYYKYLSHLQLKQYDKAANDCQKMIEINPGKNYGPHGLGFIALQKKNYSEALLHTLKALKLEANAGSYNNLGHIYFELAEYELAVTAFDKAIALDSEYHALYYNKALALEKLSKKDQAVEYYQSCLEKLDKQDEYNTSMKKEEFLKYSQKRISKLTKNKAS